MTSAAHPTVFFALFDTTLGHWRDWQRCPTGAPSPHAQPGRVGCSKVGHVPNAASAVAGALDTHPLF